MTSSVQPHLLQTRHALRPPLWSFAWGISAGHLAIPPLDICSHPFFICWMLQSAHPQDQHFKGGVAKNTFCSPARNIPMQTAKRFPGTWAAFLQRALRAFVHVYYFFHLRGTNSFCILQAQYPRPTEGE